MELKDRLEAERNVGRSNLREDAVNAHVNSLTTANFWAYRPLGLIH